MSDQKFPTCLYRAGEAQVFQLAPGEELPDGWFDNPAKAEAAGKPRHPFDHDGDGKPGGSLPKAKRARK